MMRNIGDKVTMIVSKRGAVVVNDSNIFRDHGGTLLVEVDLYSKHADLAGRDSGPTRGPGVSFCANEITRNIDIAMPMDAMTEIEFPDLVGWHVWASDMARYTCLLVLVAPWE
jgi:hypothetical protein